MTPRLAGWVFVHDLEELELAPGDAHHLGRVLRLHRAVEVTGGKDKKPSPPPCVCECGRKIRVAPTVLAAGPITCGVCGTDFAPDVPDQDDGDGSDDGEAGE